MNDTLFNPFSYNKRYFKNMAGIINLIWSFEDKLFPGR